MRRRERSKPRCFSGRVSHAKAMASHQAQKSTRPKDKGLDAFVGLAWLVRVDCENCPASVGSFQFHRPVPPTLLPPLHPHLVCPCLSTFSPKLNQSYGRHYKYMRRSIGSSSSIASPSLAPGRAGAASTSTSNPPPRVCARQGLSSPTYFFLIPFRCIFPPKKKEEKEK